MLRPVNRLAQATSPYLLSHADNPVDWYPWGEEALRRAKEEDKPIFLSIGYSACHWCHVMARESFEDPSTAQPLNDHFVSIKVDREERPDLDELYMAAVQTLTGQGGWPMSVWLTPDLQPFYGGTYFPPTPRYGMPAFKDLLERVARLWKERRQEVIQEAGRLSGHLEEAAILSPGHALPDADLASEALMHLRRSFDGVWGGFGRAPKFPPTLSLELILQQGTPEDRSMVIRTLDAMWEGGMYDHLGGGFARYSVDEKWLVPHFEKMLYDNAQLVSCYLTGHLATGKARYAQVARETLDYLLRDMRDPSGGFYSSEDADSEGEEGRFYVFTLDEIRSELEPEEADLFCEAFGVSAGGNFEGRNILHRIPGTKQRRDLSEPALEARLNAAKALLLDFRSRRCRPHRDDKILASWNGLALSALSRGFQALGDGRYLQAATTCAEFLHRELRKEGQLLRTWRLGHAHTAAFLEDYAALILGLVDLYESGFEVRWLRWAEELAGVMRRDFLDAAGGFWSAGPGHSDLLFRQKQVYDGSLPSGNALAVKALLRLGAHLQEEMFTAEAERSLVALAPVMESAPRSCLGLLAGLELLRSGSLEIAVAGDSKDPRTQEFLRVAWREWNAARAISLAAVDSSQFRDQRDGKPTAHVCREHTCSPPVFTAEALRAQMTSC